MFSSAKQKGKAVDASEHGASSRSPSPSSESDSSSDDSDTESITSEYLESLLQKARDAAVAKKQKQSAGPQLEAEQHEDDVILLDSSSKQDLQPLPDLDPGPSLPRPYFKLGSSHTEGSLLIHDVDAEGVQRAAPAQPASLPPPELNRDGNKLTKRQKKDKKKETAGANWFDLPAPAAADLPRLYREVEALRLRNSLDPKRFYRKEEGEGKGIKGLPKHFAIGTIIPTSTPFGQPSSENLAKSQRKRTVVDELVDDAEARRYAKKKFMDLQGVRGERGRGTWARKQAARRGKW